MKLTAAVGSLRAALAAEVRAGERAATKTMKTETDALKDELRRQIATAFGAKGRSMSGSWRGKVFPPTGLSLRPAGLVWSKMPAVVEAHDRGALIRPKGGRRFLAIPTGFNRTGRTRRSAVRVTPEQMVASGRAFVLRMKSGKGLLWCLPTNRPTARQRNRFAISAGGVTTINTAKNREARRRYADLIEQGMVPMFLLLPQVKLTKRLDVDGAARRAGRRLPGAFVSAWRQEAGRA